MALDSSPPAESRPLLDTSNAPATYNTVNTPASLDPLLSNNVSRIDLFWVMTGLCSTVFLSAMDGTVVATLLSPIGSYFKRAEQASYLGTAYLLSLCCFSSLYGRLSDILGRKGAMLLALSLFGSGTIGCGFAPSMMSLILARAIAGMGGGGIVTVTSITISDLVPLKQRGLYQGVINIMFGLGTAVGGPVGGWINDTWGWRATFLSQAPLLFLSFILVALKVNIKMSDIAESESVYTKLGRIDFLGSFTLVVSVASMLSAMSIQSTEELPWSHLLIWGLLAVSGVFGLAFIYVEVRWARYPVMPLRLLAQRTPLAVVLAGFFVSMVSFSMLYNFPLYFSAVRLTSSAEAGLHLVPQSVAMPISVILVGWWIRRTGRIYNVLLCSVALCVVASALIASWNEKTSTLDLWLDIVPHGIGFGNFISAMFIAMVASVPREDIAVATGLIYLFRYTGQVLGVSLSGTLVQSILVQQLRQRITGPDSLDIIEEIRHSISTIPQLEPHLRQAAVDSYATAFRVVFVIQTGASILALIACIAIEERTLPGSHQEQDEFYRRQQGGNNRLESES